MKNSILMLLLIFGISVNSQTQNYTIIIIPEKPYNPYEHIKPVNYTNWGNAYNALAYKQAKYDTNYQEIKNIITKLSNSINSLDATQEEKGTVRNIFEKQLSELDKKGGYDLGDDNIFTKVVTYIYDSYNSGVKKINADRKKKQEEKNTPKVSSIEYSLVMETNFNKTIKVKQISVYDKNDKLLRVENITDDSYVQITKGNIKFKKADGTLSFRNLTYKKHDDSIYTYTSSYGNVEIHRSLFYVKFYDDTIEGERYVYYLESL